MAKSKSRKKKGKNLPKITPKSYIRKRGRQIPVKVTYINDDWKTMGMATVIVIRQMGNDYLLVGTYVVDVFCLGIKDTHFWYKVTEDEFEDQIMSVFTHRMGLNMEECEPQLAFNVIYGALEYAEDLGFEPHSDFNLTELILPKVEDVEYMDIKFGKNGKPFYISGPNDDYNKIYKKLDKLGLLDGIQETNEDDDGFLDFEEVE